MALVESGNNDCTSLRASSNVSAITYTVTNNALAYSSGGIPFGTAVVADTGTGFQRDIKAANSAGQVGVMGIACDYPAVGPGQEARIQFRGIAKALAAGVVNYGDYVYVADSSGRLGTQPGAGNYAIVGQSLSPATVQAGDYFSVQLMLTPGKVVEP